MLPDKAEECSESLQAKRLYLKKLGIDIWLSRSWVAKHAHLSPAPPRDSDNSVRREGNECQQGYQEKAFGSGISDFGFKATKGRQAPSAPLKAPSGEEPLKRMVDHLLGGAPSGEPEKPATKQAMAVVDAPNVGTEVAPESADPIKFSLLIQPIMPGVTLLCELDDADAPGLSTEEDQLLKGILQATGGLMENCVITMSHNLFRWPVVNSRHSRSLFSDQLFVNKALEGLLQSQVTESKGYIILLSDRLNFKGLSLPIGAEIFQFSSLTSMARGDRQAKGRLWKQLQVILR